MKTFMKVFIISFLSFTLIIGGGIVAFLKFYDPEPVVNPRGDDLEVVETPGKEDKVPMNDFEKLIYSSKRLNVLLLGMEGPRTDTIILASFDPESKNVDLISIPRDTYFQTKGYNKPEQKKINAVYGRSGVKGTMEAVSNVLGGIPIHEYIELSYEGVEKIVDSRGGVKVNIPFNMRYDDPYDTPPLKINLPKGERVLNGKEAIQFLRFRKNNDGKGYPDGDLGRIKAQQQFMMAAAEKALSFRLPVVANTVFKYVKTSMKLDDVLYYAKNAIGITKDNIKTYSLPGKSVNQGLSYFIHDPEETKELIMKIYRNER